MHPLNEQRLHYYHVLVFAIATAVFYMVRMGGIPFPLSGSALAQAALTGAGTSFVGVLALDRWLWKNRLVRLVLSISTPDLNGRWEGHVRSSYSGHQVRYPIALEISQTLGSISITYYDERAISRSVVAGFVKDVGGTVGLFYVYRNEPILSDQASLQIHYGTVQLSVVDAKRGVLHGVYYNNYQQRPTYGDLDATLQGKKLQHSFS